MGLGRVVGDFNLNLLVVKMCNLGEKWKIPHHWKCIFMRSGQLSTFGVLRVFDLATTIVQWFKNFYRKWKVGIWAWWKNKFNIWTWDEREMSDQSYTYNDQLHTSPPPKRKQLLFSVLGHIVKAQRLSEPRVTPPSKLAKLDFS